MEMTNSSLGAPLLPLLPSENRLAPRLVRLDLTPLVLMLRWLALRELRELVLRVLRVLRDPLELRLLQLWCPIIIMLVTAGSTFPPSISSIFPMVWASCMAARE